MNAQGVAYAPQQIPPNPAFYSAQNKGTLNPGQVIQIQSLTVTVERFLSQGGFAHVYLVRTATPVNGTNQHVLKRMLVADHIMLQDVKKEVDIMRILKGHANIVNLIDSAWNRLQDGRYEVFILMEFCAGGGIIDMMNRRLRERLTEGEILQIFVDVCEGLASMHNLHPALLHRDLKVENILQANENSYKLCDFGSATAVSKPPTTAAEMRALEYDLNRHTTLQYRAPEMVEPHLRRPIDEKSDVWALGVLLYKLCYYTTPFEEHGPLAILHVQYKIPPYPLYSQNMIGLITSILREHGTQRPSVFEILDSVHRMRGTKSRYTYNPRPQPSSPGIPRSPEDIVSFRPPLQVDSNNTKPLATSAVQARQTIVDAIQPMRRGRPNVGGPVVTAPGNGMYVDDLDLPTPRGGHFKSVTTSERWASAAREAPAALGGNARPSHLQRSSQEWIQSKVVKEEPKTRNSLWDGLGSLDSSEKSAMNGFGDAFNPNSTSLGTKQNQQNQQNATAVRSPPASSSSSNPSTLSYQLQTAYQSPNIPPPTAAQQSRFTMPTPSRLLQAPRIPVQTKPKDSFGELGAPSTSAPSISVMMRPPSNASTHNGLVSAFSRPSTAADSVASNGTGLSSAAVVEGFVALSAAERFPPIEQIELGVREKPWASPLRPRSPLGPRAPSPAKANFSLNRPPAYAGLSRMSYTGGLTLDHDITSPPPPLPLSGVRSQQVTGTAMKGTAPAVPVLQSTTVGGGTKPNASSMPPPAFQHTPATPTRLPLVERPPSRFPTAERPIAPNRKPIVARRRGNTMELKVDSAGRENQQPIEHDLLWPGPPAGSQPLMTQRTPSPSAVPQRDWLMDDDIVLHPVAKASTGSLQPRLPTPDTTYVDPNKAKRATMGTALISFGKGPTGGMGVAKHSIMESTVAGWQRGLSNMPPPHQPHTGPPTTSTSSGVALPGLAKKMSQEGSPVRRRSNTTSSRLSRDEPPPPNLPPRPMQQQPRGSSPQPKRHNHATLTDNWSPVNTRFPMSAKSTFGEAQTGADSSGNEDGPEDIQSSTSQQMRWREQERQMAPAPIPGNLGQQGPGPEHRMRKPGSSPKQQHQGRQGSVHGLVDLWSGSAKPLSGQSQQEEPSHSVQRFDHQREPSKDLIKFPDAPEPSELPTQNAYNRAVHLFPPMEDVERRQSPSSASGSEKDTDAPRPQLPQKRFSGSKGRPTQLSQDRMRPQSLFISPGNGPNQLAYPRSSPPDALSVPSPSSNTSAPHGRQGSQRRGSISDIVSRYEALSVVSSTTSGYTASNESGPTSPKPKPVVGTKPAALRSSGMQNSMVSPSGNASFFPPIDPSTLQKEPVKMNAPVKMRTSPLLFKSMESPTDPPQSYGSISTERESPVFSLGHSQNLHIPIGDRGRISPGSQTGTVSDMNEDILVVSPRPRITPKALDYHPEASLARARTPPMDQSPSPELAYKGVGKLIDQWQKKTEEAEGKARVGVKPTGPRQLQRRDLPPGKPPAAS